MVAFLRQSGWSTFHPFSDIKSSHSTSGEMLQRSSKGLWEMYKEEKLHPSPPGASRLVQVTSFVCRNSSLVLTSFKTSPKICLPQAALHPTNHSFLPHSVPHKAQSFPFHTTKGRSAHQWIPVCSVQPLCQHHEDRVWVFFPFCPSTGMSSVA